jgi:hypothetical protein
VWKFAETAQNHNVIRGSIPFLMREGIMRRAPFVITLGVAGILVFAVAPASAQHRSGGGENSGAGGAPAAATQRSDSGARSSGRYTYGPRYYAPVRFFSPYYAFRPRFSLGFGLFIGYPITYSSPYYYPDYFYPNAYPYPYSYSYAYPYPYPYPYVRTYPGPTYYQAPAGLDLPYPPQSQNSVGVQTGLTRQAPAGLDAPDLGGVTFEITPSDARVIVDGQDVGSVGQFTPTSPALGLPVGRHHLEIVANGYRTMSSDVDVRVGQVIPFQGQMER